MVKIHPREKVVKEARIKLIEFLITLQNDLTSIEYLQLILSVMGTDLADHFKYALRAERHPNDTDKPSGWA